MESRCLVRITSFSYMLAMDRRKATEWFAVLLILTEYSVALQWYNSGTQTTKIGANLDLQWRYKLTASEQQSAQDFSMLLWERETTLNSDEWVTVAALQPSTGKKITTDSRIVLGSNLTLHISYMESIYFSRFRCTFVSSFASSSSNLILKEEDRRKDVRVRLVDGSSPNQGRVEVYHQGAWGTVCHNAWDERDATVVCGMLGYPLGSSYCCSSYGRGSDTIWLDNVSCQGNESSIVDCKHSEWGINNCTHASDAGVYCYGPTPAEPSTVPAPTPTSTPNFRVRLVNGSTPNQGRVEVLYGGAWGTVCHNHWDSRNAKVVCNMLGYPLGYPYCCGRYGRGSGPIWMDKMFCNGTEGSLSMCSHVGWANNSCDHSMDVGVYCYFPLPPTPSTTAPPTPPTSAPDFKVRLVNGQSPNQGRVEVYREGTWGTVCDTNWDTSDAMVTCRMLGYIAGYAYCCGIYGNGTGPVWLDEVACGGNETSLASCGHGGWGNNKCGHSSDAGVYCLAPPRPTVPTVPTEPTTVITTPTRCPPQPTVQATSGINCTFDGGLCGWTAVDPFRPGMMKWTSHSGSTPTEYTGPDGDHTSGCGSYMYMEATGSNQSDSAILASPVLSGNGKPSCFSFYYHMNGSGMGRMAVAAGSNIVWVIAGSRGSHWNSAYITLNVTSSFQLYIIGAIGSSDKSDIAVDDISYVAGSSCPDGVGPSATTAPPVLSGDCSFDTDLCGWTNVQGDQFDWTRNRGGTPTGGTGPSGDHSSGSGWYVYLEASAPRLEGDIARLISPVLKAGNSCLTFYYHMFDVEKDLDKVVFAQLKVKVDGKSVWQTSGNHGNRWYKAMASINSENPFQVTLEGVRGSNAWCDIAVDDIRVLENTQCPLEANCTFEDGFCGWTNAEGGKIDWGRNYGPTLSQDTGPSIDHTTQTKTGHYIFIETSNRSPGDSARLISQELGQTTKCMSFYYHMFGATVSTLTIKAGGLTAWTISGNQGNYWYKATVPLEFVRPFKVTIEGSAGSSYTGDIAVDDVMFSNYKCNLTASSKIPARVISVSNNQIVKAGDQVELQCVVSGSVAVPTHVAWVKEEGGVIQNDTVKRNYTISSVKIEDAGVYTCVATNAYGKDHKETGIEVQYGPRNTTLSTSAPHNVAAPGESVDITCLTKSNPKSSCTLLMKRPDESIHALASSLPGVFVIPSYSTSQHYGAYLCRCSNELSFQDKFLILSTYAIPKIEAILPASQTINETEPIHLFCNATGNPPPNITWSKVGDPSRTFPAGSTLTVSESVKADSGAFQCKADNGRGSDTTLATVSFRYTVPTISAGPQNTTVYEHDKSSVTLTCNATGDPAPSITWKKDKTQTILARGEQLTLSNVTRKDQGLYICVANNGIGTNASASAMLHVLYKPASTVLETDNTNPVVIGNGKILLICKSNANPPAHNYSFYRDGYYIGKTDSGEFTISPARKCDQGQYRCQPQNEVGIGETAELHLTVYEPLEIITPPQSQAVEEGNSVSLFCNASSSLPVKILWEKAGEDGKTLFVGNTLSLTRVSKSDAGSYKCIAKNGVAFPTSATAVINVLYHPEVTKLLVKTNTGVVRLYETVHVTCSADSNPPPNSFSFYLNDSIIQSGAANVYTIKVFNTSDVGMYSCVPSNTVGVGQKTSIDIAIEGEITGNFSKCYKANITTFYKVPGGVALRSSHTLSIVFTLLKLVVLSVRASPSCAGARVSGYRQYNGPPGVDDVYVGLELEFSAKETVPSQEIASSVSSCVDYVTTLKPQMSSTVPAMTVDGTAYRRHNISISEKRSCCGDSAPPCCTTPGVQLSVSQCVFPFNVRLVNGSSPNEGRVEVYRQGVWGTVCGSNWDINDAHVVCRMLGYASATAASCCSVYGSGVGQIWLRNVSCNGNEASLVDCPHGGWGGDNCHHGQDASVVCSTEKLNITSTTQSPLTTVASTKAPSQNMSGSPIIIQMPLDATVNQSEDASFVCKATGVPTPTITWTKVGESRVYSQVETLTMLKVSKGDRGTYKCEASNGNGDRAIAFAVLSVMYPPCNTRLQTDNVNPVVLGNGRITLICSTDAYPSPQYSFYKDSNLLVTSSSGRFVIQKAKASDEGSYKCESKNALGGDESVAINLKVYAPLSIDKRPVDTTVNEGNTASLFCNATSPLPVRISWESLGVKTRVLPHGETLLFSNVVRSDEGSYRCVARNGLAYQDSATVSLTVRYKPQNTRLAAIPDDVVTLNRSMSLKCSTEALPLAISFKFYHGLNLLQQSSSPVYYIASMTEAQNGSYSCVPVNALGEGRRGTVQITIGVPCGVRHLIPSAKAKIVGGKDADPGAYPWQAQISHKVHGHICGGTILTSKFIVSAAHCFPLKRGSNYTITLGEHSLRTTDGHEQKIEVEKIIRHKNYTYVADEHDYDIALAKLKTPIKLDGLRAAPVCIPDSNFTVGTSCTISGWGSLSYRGRYPDILQEAKVKLISQESCRAAYGVAEITPRMLCAGGNGVTDTCQGDSGGPLVCQGDHKFYLTGVTSWGFGCATKGKPGVYANIMLLRQWIEENINNNL